MGEVVVLVCRVRGRACALPLPSVIEAMRPQPIDPLAGTPECVMGISMIRGIPTPVVEVGALLGGGEQRGSISRFVTVRAGARPVALAVDGVVGVRTFPAAALSAMPPLLRGAGGESVSAVGALDSDLMLVLDAARTVPESAWPPPDDGGGPA